MQTLSLIKYISAIVRAAMHCEDTALSALCTYKHSFYAHGGMMYQALFCLISLYGNFTKGILRTRSFGDLIDLEHQTLWRFLFLSLSLSPSRAVYDASYQLFCVQNSVGNRSFETTFLRIDNSLCWSLQLDLHFM